MIGWLLVAWATLASATPWMVAHGYTRCAQCHVDPSGAGTLTDYGRAQGEVLVRTRWRGPAEDPVAGFLYGAVDLPDGVQVQADSRYLAIPKPGDPQVILMQADVHATAEHGRFVAGASAGVVSDGALAARVLRSSKTLHPVARTWWAGARVTDETLVRAGRMNVPFGNRTDNHLQYVRSTTRTSINADQQAGLALSTASRRFRAEAMVVAGNPAVAPDAWRERGVVADLVWIGGDRLSVGTSALWLTTGRDLDTARPRTRGAHAATLRWSPAERVALLAEADLLLEARPQASFGTAGIAEVDWEPVQGLHLRGSGEWCSLADGSSAQRVGGGVKWYIASGLDVRLDAWHGPLRCLPGAEARPMGTAQLHVRI